MPDIMPSKIGQVRLMSYQFPLRRIAKLLLILFAIQIPVTAIADPAAFSHPHAVKGEMAGFTPVTISSRSIDEPFGLTAANTADGESIAIWRSVESGLRTDHEILVRRQANEDCPPAAQRLLKIVADGHNSSGRAEIGIINRAINLAIQPTKATTNRARQTAGIRRSKALPADRLIARITPSQNISRSSKQGFQQPTSGWSSCTTKS